MSNTPHELVEDFPDKAQLIRTLKENDEEFARLVDEYNEVNNAVYRAETLIEPMEELAEVELRKKRALLKDRIWAILSHQ